MKKNTLNPEFNEQFEFYIPMEKLKDYTLEVIVMDKDITKLKVNEISSASVLYTIIKGRLEYQRLNAE